MLTDARKHTGLEADALLSAIVDSSDDAIVSKNLDGIIMSWNKGAERLFGYTADEAVGRHVSLIIPQEREGEEPQIIERLKRGERVDHFETVRRRKDGTLVDISLTISPVRDKNGKIVGASKIARDITERKRTEEKLRLFAAELERRVAERTRELSASNRELEAFCYSVSHDLRAPLRSIVSFSQLLRKRLWEKLDDETTDFFLSVEDASRQMATLIDDLLELSRVTRRELVRRSLELSGMAEAVVSNLRKGQPERDVTFLNAPGLRGDGDPTLLGMALQNLLENAWKFTGKTEGAVIELGRTSKDGRTVFFVRDNGAGFDMAYAGKLFGVFQRLHRPEDFPGTGIGLVTVQRIIQRHGGEVWADAHVDRGATFYFTLPEGGASHG